MDALRRESIVVGKDVDVVLQLCGDDDLLKWMSQIGIRTCEVVGMARSFYWPVVLRPWERVGVLYSKPS